MIDFLQTATRFGGIALCAMALLQFAFWSGQSLSLIAANRKQFELSLNLLRKQIEASSPVNQHEPDRVAGNWSGYRTFRVVELIDETDVCTSVYLQPEDGKPIVSFQPGQHLTFKLQIEGEPSPVVRCYSLSDRPDQDFYRITVKSVPAPMDRDDLPPGRASNFIVNALKENERVEIKAPSGHFVLDEISSDPIVLLAGGIGITPMISMINYLTAMDSERLILLVYGVKNSSEHAFKKHLESLSKSHENLHLLNCYSQPNPEDVEDQDYHVHGFASADVLKRILPDNRCQFYLCGPPPFMESLYDGLVEWGVPQSQIFFEAFGPASIGKTRGLPSTDIVSGEAGTCVKFTTSDITAEWSSECSSLLELAELNDANIDYGCRAGSCGTCQTVLLKGNVTYPENLAVECPPGTCLACIARPDGPVELEA